ncbi:MAG: Heavy-chain fibroin (Fragment) [uncultured Ramlibacter sp.]|uniref:Heavy-chain fibroin n=1 Tax=uncultured Ramlibacter sp. TaxID=260755 RepID=A0A6J4NT27_9BURK
MLLSACGGGGDGGSRVTDGTASGERITAPPVPGANVVAVQVDRGIDGSAINAPFVTVTVCQPGTGACHDIDHVLVDTGSSGLRIASSALPAGFALPGVTTGGNPVGQCAQFASGYSWGSVRRADVRMAGETAFNLPIQVVEDPAAPFAAVPGECSATGPSIGAGRGAKGILGVGLFNQDCGPACEVSSAPNVYFACSPGRCSPARLPQESQVANPVAAFPVNNNGVVLVLPPVPREGAAGLTGSLVFGIGTQSNNQLGGATVYTTNSRGFFTTTYKGVNYPASFLDSGSNGLFFDDPDLPRCGDFYCPRQSLSLTATNTSASGVSGTVAFTVEDVTALRPDTAAANLAGNAGLTGSFDWGLPFFFGRAVYVARAGAETPAGPGPYWAY